MISVFHKISVGDYVCVMPNNLIVDNAELYPPHRLKYILVNVNNETDLKIEKKKIYAFFFFLFHVKKSRSNLA